MLCCTSTYTGYEGSSTYCTHSGSKDAGLAAIEMPYPCNRSFSVQYSTERLNDTLYLEKEEKRE